MTPPPPNTHAHTLSKMENLARFLVLTLLCDVQPGNKRRELFMQPLRCEVVLLQCTAPSVHCLSAYRRRALLLDEAIKLHFLSTTGPFTLIIEAIFSQRRQGWGSTAAVAHLPLNSHNQGPLPLSRAHKGQDRRDYWLLARKISILGSVAKPWWF